MIGGDDGNDFDLALAYRFVRRSTHNPKHDNASEGWQIEMVGSPEPTYDLWAANRFVLYRLFSVARCR